MFPGPNNLFEQNAVYVLKPYTFKVKHYMLMFQQLFTHKKNTIL